MDPATTRSTTTRLRFPRPRGDGPLAREPKHRATLVSPPTRGWTPIRLRQWFFSRGFPAHAGMDPGRATIRTMTCRFPRPRGDGPQYFINTENLDLVSPPTRGWTRTIIEDTEAALGFPAHAGMDPRSLRVRWVRPWFPRPRGDGPVRSHRMSPSGGVSPPTRGWTASGAHCAATYKGFPAHAGMDPLTSGRSTPHARFPRPRGDGPFGLALSMTIENCALPPAWSERPS